MLTNGVSMYCFKQNKPPVFNCFDVNIYVKNLMVPDWNRFLTKLLSNDILRVKKLDFYYERGGYLRAALGQ